MNLSLFLMINPYLPNPISQPPFFAAASIEEGILKDGCSSWNFFTISKAFATPNSFMKVKGAFTDNASLHDFSKSSILVIPKSIIKDTNEKYAPRNSSLNLSFKSAGTSTPSPCNAIFQLVLLFTASRNKSGVLNEPISFCRISSRPCAVIGGNRFKEGWEISLIEQAQAGNPLNFHTSSTAFTGSANLRPNV